MHYSARIAASLGLATLILLSLGAAHAAEDIITFDNFANQPGRNSVAPLTIANGGSSLYDGVTFSDNSSVLGDQFTNGGSSPLATPHSGNYAFATANHSTTLTTTKTLYGLYLGQISSPTYAATSVTINALSGSTTLASLTDALTGTTPAFFDTSSFASLTGITSYTLVGSNPNDFNAHDFVGDDFTFSPPVIPPVPPITGTFDFENNTVGQRTAFTDTSNGINATFSTSFDTNRDGYIVLNDTSIFNTLNSKYLSYQGSTFSPRLPLAVAFDHTLGTVSVSYAFSDPGTFTVQELLNGKIVGTATATGTLQNGVYQGKLSTGGVIFDSLSLSSTASNLAIDNLTVSAVPEVSTTLSLGLMLSLGGLLLRARRRHLS